MREFVLVGPLPPPITGQAVAFEMLVKEVQEQGYACLIVDISPRQVDQRSGKIFSIGNRLKEYPLILKDFFRKAAFGQKVIYITIAASRRGFFRDVPMIWFARLFGHRVIGHVHGGSYGQFYQTQSAWMKMLIRATLREVDRIIVLGERLRSMFDFDPSLAPRIDVVPNGLPDDSFSSGQTKMAPELAREPIRILFLSNLIESKGYLDVLEAVRILTGRLGSERVECHFAGEFIANPADDVRVRSAEHGKEIFERFVQQNELHEKVVYHGVASGAAKRCLLESCHFLVLPTNYFVEGQPISIIEAMAHGMIVISTNYRAIPDMIQDRITGRFVPYGDPSAIASVIHEVVSDPDLFARMSVAAREHFLCNFTGRVHLDLVISVLLESERRSSDAMTPMRSLEGRSAGSPLVDQPVVE